jgi:hypothetical protein
MRRRRHGLREHEIATLDVPAQRYLCRRRAKLISQLATPLKIQHETPSNQPFTAGEIFGIYPVDFQSIPDILFHGNASFSP